MIDDSTNDLIQYCLDYSDNQPEVLYELERETYLKTLAPQMLSGHLQGLILSMVSKMIQPDRILELGTFTGYSAICLAQGLSKNGYLHTIEVNDELQPIFQKYFKKAGLEKQIISHLGDAAQIIPSLEETFDLVFIDAGKKDYPNHFSLIKEKVRKGGFILVDNTLWSGKVLNRISDKGTLALDQFNKMIKNDRQFENVILPIRDGLTLIRKI